MDKERVLMTGANGFIGSATFKELEERGSKIIKFNGRIQEISDWEKNLHGDEISFLIAGIRTETDIDFVVNSYSIEKLFESATRLNKLPKKVVLSSSQAVYMGNKVPFEESQVPLPATIYGQSKLMGERIVQKWCSKLEIPLVILRYSTVLGEGIRQMSKMSGPLFAWTKAAVTNEPIKVFQDGNQSRDYVHVIDVALANILAIHLPSGIYNVGGGKPIKLFELANWIKEAAGSESQIVIMGGDATEADPRKMFSDTTKIKNYGWKPEKTAKEAVEEFVYNIGK
jgi:nucleoside-diphosphate-sugar epimerase